MNPNSKRGCVAEQAENAEHVRYPNWTEVARYGAEQAEEAEEGGHFWIYADGSITQTSYDSPDLDHAGLRSSAVRVGGTPLGSSRPFIVGIGPFLSP